MEKARTHEEWFVGVRQKYWDEKGEKSWSNANLWMPNAKLGDRYVGSETQARQVLNNAYTIWNGEKFYNEKGERYETQKAGSLGVTLVSTKETDEDMRIVKHIIRKRTVTDWETVERG